MFLDVVGLQGDILQVWFCIGAMEVLSRHCALTHGSRYVARLPLAAPTLKPWGSQFQPDVVPPTDDPGALVWFAGHGSRAGAEHERRDPHPLCDA